MDLTDSVASWTGPRRFSLTSCAACFAGAVKVSECSEALSLTWVATCCSLSLAGSSEDTSQPAPNAMTPAASGLPRVCERTADGAEDAASVTLEPAEDIALPDVDVAPITFSFSPPTAPLAASTLRPATAEGLTFSCRTSTSVARSRRVCSMSRRISSGLVVIVGPPSGP